MNTEQQRKYSVHAGYGWQRFTVRPRCISIIVVCVYTGIDLMYCFNSVRNDNDNRPKGDRSNL